MAEIEQSKLVAREKFIRWAIQISQNQGPISSQFSIKIQLLFALIGYFSSANGPTVKDQEVTAKVRTTFSEASHQGLADGEKILVVAQFKFWLFQLSVVFYTFSLPFLGFGSFFRNHAQRMEKN